VIFHKGHRRICIRSGLWTTKFSRLLPESDNSGIQPPVRSIGGDELYQHSKTHGVKDDRQLY